MKYQFLFLLGIIGGAGAFTGFGLFIIQNAAPERLTFAMISWAVFLLMYATSLSVLMCDAQDNAHIVKSYDSLRRKKIENQLNNLNNND